EVDEVDGLVQDVGQRAVALPGVQRPVRVLERLLLLLAELRGELVDLPELFARLGRLDGSGGRRLARSFGRRLDVAAFAPAIETAGDGIRRSRPRPGRAVGRHPHSFRPLSPTYPRGAPGSRFGHRMARGRSARIRDVQPHRIRGGGLRLVLWTLAWGAGCG